MLRATSRSFTSCSRLGAAVSRGKPQGFAKKAGSNGRTAAKKVSAGSLYKSWDQTVATSQFNRNASPVALPKFESKDVSKSLNEVVSYSSSQYKALYHLGSFKQNQRHELFPRPVSLVREATTRRLFDAIKNSGDRKFVLTGEPGVGKSTLLTQVHALAVEQKSVILNISHPDLFLDGRNDFYHDGKEYVQPMYLKRLFSKLLKSNDADILASIPLKDDHKLLGQATKESSVGKSSILTAKRHTLLDLLSFKAAPRSRGEQFTAVIKELMNQANVPVFVTVDNFSRMLSEPFSAYKDTANRNVHIFSLQLGRTIMDIVSGKIGSQNSKSCVILATSGSDRTNRTLPIGLGKLDHDPYIRLKHYEPKLAELLKEGQVKEFMVEKLTKEEVKQLLKFYLKSEIFLKRDSQDKEFDQVVDEKYFLSGNGNPRELLKSLVLHMA
ncbi:LAMI_0G10066g1_1 [Lachancea mirantina]|uniref:Small ribosomal subunit protein mS29 n=1 Tax=Lachancea mirantina TaxID=1230905 RepID=A0A1G4KAH4_9SACH|nr:LAMI_0G10066g1_1 [Lachancea mirantina]